jgi:SAM-dependent methyltransferase
METVLDATALPLELQDGSFDKCFSNAAMHWILRPEEKREQFFRGVRNALKPGGVFAFEMGGMGNVAEV